MTKQNSGNEILFSIHTDQHVKDAVDIFGYAYGYNRISKHFDMYSYKNKKLKLVENDPSSNVQLFYMEPEWYNVSTMENLRDPNLFKFWDHQYKIIGTHLEATKVWDHWIDTMNSVDEIWVGNFFARDAVLNSGVTTPTYVFEHGIDDMWKKKKRGTGSKIRFLHVDSGSPRKRADMVEAGFKAAFGHRDDVELTLKYHSHESTGGFSVMNLFVDESYKNIHKIFETISQEELVDLFHSHDVLLYPSEGEGFGFIPLQALATGMPVISTSRWCSYEKFLGDNIIESTIGKTKHTGYYHGEVVLPEFDSFVYLLKKVYEDIQGQCDYYYDQADQVYKEYNWQTRCDSMLDSFIKRVGISTLYKTKFNLEDFSKPIYYQGFGSYSTVDGVRFDTSNRVARVSKDVYENLIRQEAFRDATEKETNSL